ncbi:Na(+)/H(+)-K(+) antiporter GerN [Methylacidimicrobium cyclopophantes]|uniref:Na(+)/H(+)-K(+) antiporter GerN n=1 Tax=Methylacidimicrobium cyclopophantes TaxID=1041766 RepID=A0A5E6M558_9BACT|nr:cation:proton antiporter [Methylacidimicrobium cyclopophantes]VVM04446.1 Na(+)/H(+)-K(+) antiporter GerN [Methylacidimicrobium cyclopophantes]
MSLANPWVFLALWMGAAFLAAVVALHFRVSVALMEVLIGILMSHLLKLAEPTEWMVFLARLGSVTLAFLAGTEIDPVVFRRQALSSLSIGILSFLFPFGLVYLIAHFVLGWNVAQSLIAGIALATTSVAIVYTAVVEKGMEATRFGQLLLSSCFVTDFGSVLFLGLFFTHWSWNSLFLLMLALVILAALPFSFEPLLRWLRRSPVSEPEIKFLFFALSVLGALASVAQTEPVLPAYVAGVLVAKSFATDRQLVRRMRSLAYGLLTPFFFMKAGFHISLHTLLYGALPILLFFSIKFLSKMVAVWPTLRVLRVSHREALFGSLLTSGGLTFGLIAAHFGIHNGILARDQYSEVTIAILLSTLLPVLGASRLFPHVSAMRERPEEKLTKPGEFEEEG